MAATSEDLRILRQELREHAREVRSDLRSNADTNFWLIYMGILWILVDQFAIILLLTARMKS